MIRKFIRQAKLPRGAYKKELGDVLSVYKRREIEKKKKERKA